MHHISEFHRVAAGTIVAVLSVASLPLFGQNTDDTKLAFALVFSRHGIRSPTKSNDAYAPFAIQAWPDWSVAPGYLTPHGKQAITIFGTWYRAYFVQQGLLSGADTSDVAATYFYADNAERTLETANGLATGMFPKSSIQVNSQPTGDDPLFYPVKVGLGDPDLNLAASALSGRLGSNADSLANSYGMQFQALQSVLFNQPFDTDPTLAPAGFTSVAGTPLIVSPGSAGSIVGFNGSIDTASTLAEIFLLEYCEGMPADQVGWGRLTTGQIQSIAQLHTLDFDLTDRTPFFAQTQGSNLLLRIRNTLNQAAQGMAVPHSLGQPGNKVVMLIGHDNQLASVGGLLDANWQLPSFAWTDTPPGGAMVFELRQKNDGSFVVRVYYTAQTMDQQRNLTPLTLSSGPAIAPIFIPNASAGDTWSDCPLADFNQAVQHAIRLQYTN
jgi:4-phytase/acid phosphatase